MGKTYKYLLSEKDILQVKRRSNALRGVDLVSIQYDDSRLIFKTRSGTDRKTIWTQTIEMGNLDARRVRRLTPQKLVKFIRNAELKVHCDCIAKDTEIRVSTGYKFIQSIKKGDLVLTKEGYWAKAEGLLNKGFKETKCVYIKDNPIPLIATPDHKLWVSKDNSFGWVRVEDLNSQYFLTSPDVDGSIKLIKIDKITDGPVTEVYDIVLADKSHSYVANGVSVSNCPAFHFWGVKYWAWKRGYGLEKETRRPVVRNPYGRYVACKHIYQVAQIYPFWSQTLAKKFKKAVGENIISSDRPGTNESRSGDIMDATIISEE